MNEDSAKVMFESKSTYVSGLFKDFADVSRKQRGGTAFQTVSKEYRLQLQALMDKLLSTDPHFIRCIIPNTLKKNLVF